MVLRELALVLLRRWRSLLVSFVVLSGTCLLLARLLSPVSDGPTSTRLEFVASTASAEEAAAGTAYVTSQVHGWLAVTQRDETVRQALARAGVSLRAQEASRRLVLTVPLQNVITFGLPGIPAATAVPLLDAWAQVVCETVQPTIPRGASGQPLATCQQSIKAAPTPSAASVATRELNVPLSFLVGALGALLLTLARESWARDRAARRAPGAGPAAAPPADPAAQDPSPRHPATQDHPLHPATQDPSPHDQAPLTVGVDVEDVARWRQPRRLANLFTPAELARAGAHAHPERSHAGWWAAREAGVKALADEGITVRQLHVEHDADGRPRLVVAGRDDLTAQLQLSISHSDTTAVAVVVRR